MTFVGHDSIRFFAEILGISMGVLIRISAVVLMSLSCCLYTGCAGPDAVESTMEKATEAVKEAGAEAVDGMKEKAGEAVDGMKEKASEAMGSGEKAAEGSADKAAEAAGSGDK